jgi:hypothetical protein
VKPEVKATKVTTKPKPKPAQAEEEAGRRSVRHAALSAACGDDQQRDQAAAEHDAAPSPLTAGARPRARRRWFRRRQHDTAGRTATPTRPTIVASSRDLARSGDRTPSSLHMFVAPMRH